MDTKDLHFIFPSISTSDPPLYSFKHPYPQCFSLPFDVIKYMIKNCKSAKVWKKLIMTCKHFYSKNPVFPVKHLHVYPDSKCEADEEKFNSSKFIPKFWVYDSFNYHASNFSNSKLEIPKIFKFDLRSLIMFDQNLTFNDYQKLTSSGSLKSIILYFCKIQNSDGTIVTVDKLLENLKHLEEFKFIDFNPLMFQSDTVKKMVQHLNGFKNNNKTLRIEISFYEPISDAYKVVIQNVMNKIKKNPFLKVPKIEFVNIGF
uniref:F-box domain-containing protein n=1 Tax=Panagrolaimus sp. PS1159 TaxID=55785 RepID=A0AC35F9W6_9BILA